MNNPCTRCGSHVPWSTWRCTRCTELNRMHPTLLMAKFFATIIVIVAGWLGYVAWKDTGEPRGTLEPLPKGEPGMIERLIRRTEDSPKDPSFRK